MKRQKENTNLSQRQQLQEAVAAPKSWAQKGKGLESLALRIWISDSGEAAAQDVGTPTSQGRRNGSGGSLRGASAGWEKVGITVFNCSFGSNCSLGGGGGGSILGRCSGDLKTDGMKQDPSWFSHVGSLWSAPSQCFAQRAKQKNGFVVWQRWVDLLMDGQMDG